MNDELQMREICVVFLDMIKTYKNKIDMTDVQYVRKLIKSYMENKVNFHKCHECGGSGRVNEHICNVCMGLGIEKEEE